MSSLGGCLRGVVAYESLDHIMGQNVLSLEYGNCRDPLANVVAVFSKSQLKVNFEKKVKFFPLRNFRFLY